MIRNSCFHRGRDAKRLVNPTEIVMHVMKRNGMLQILKLLGKRIGQMCKSAHSHPHRRILSFDIARRNVSMIRIAFYDRFSRTHAHGWTVSGFRCVLNFAVNFLELCVINFATKSIFDRNKVGLISVSGELNLVCQRICQQSRTLKRLSGRFRPMR